MPNSNAERRGLLMSPAAPRATPAARNPFRPEAGTPFFHLFVLDVSMYDLKQGGFRFRGKTLLCFIALLKRKV